MASWERRQADRPARSDAVSDRGWVVRVRIDGNGRKFTFFPTPERHARLLEFGVEQVFLSGEDTIDCSIMFDPDTVTLKERTVLS